MNAPSDSLKDGCGCCSNGELEEMLGKWAEMQALPYITVSEVDGGLEICGFITEIRIRGVSMSTPMGYPDEDEHEVYKFIVPKNTEVEAIKERIVRECKKAEEAQAMADEAEYRAWKDSKLEAGKKR